MMNYQPVICCVDCHEEFYSTWAFEMHIREIDEERWKGIPVEEKVKAVLG